MDRVDQHAEKLKNATPWTEKTGEKVLFSYNHVNL